ncbi:hypothetical protein [Campylobacter devanensis]|uniref:hypothetical protein n=1 Tax=Campylobacter devanensis TaxID=3161138 RepID=UPI000A3568A2|nr:hypothetical protein [Campylobacter sp. P0134]
MYYNRKTKDELIELVNNINLILSYINTSSVTLICVLCLMIAKSMMRYHFKATCFGLFIKA